MTENLTVLALLGNVVSQALVGPKSRLVVVRFVRTLLLVCNHNFERLELEKHSNVDLVPSYNVALIRFLLLKTFPGQPGLGSFQFQAPSFRAG